jgi:exopolysaccharide biosynthesis polyprenyl glycosylphosphotransferase
MPRLRNSPALPAAIDSLIALGLAVGAVLWVNKRYIPQGGFAEFLRIRITLLNASFSVVFVILWKQCLTVLGLFGRDLDGLRSLVLRTATACAIMTALLDLYLQARHARGPIGQILVTFLLLAFLYETCRVLVCSHQRSWHVIEPQRVIIVGSGRRASKAWRELRIQHHRTKRLLGFVDDRHPDSMPPDIASRLIGNVDDLPGYLLRNIVDELIVATPMRSCYDLTQRAVSIAEAAGVRVVCLNDIFTLAQEKDLRGRATLFVELVPKDHRRETAETTKRILDVLGAAAGIVLLAPVFLVIGLAIKLTSPGSIFFVQERHGYGRRRFRMFKFRSMVRNASDRMVDPGPHDAAGGAVLTTSNDPRMTPLGRFLHRTFLDELPALWNVLLGDMSLVGPRPMSAHEVSRFGEAQLMRRFSVRPGMTGNWQVAEDPSLNFEQRAALDFSYIDEWSLALDLKILARTVPAMLKRSSVVS